MAKTFSIHAGRHRRSMCPLNLKGAESTVGAVRLVDVDNPAASCPVQADDDGLWTILGDIPAGKTKTFKLSEGAAESRVKVRQEQDLLHLLQMDEVITTYHFGSDLARPFFHPVIGPNGLAMTRAWPIVEGVEGEETDHIHHRSFYVAHGLINGSDHWEEKPEHGWQRHSDFVEKTEGPVFGGFKENLVWTTTEGKELMGETREFRLWNVPSPSRLFDLSLTFTAEYGDVVFGDTKEGGLCAFRVAESMKEKRTGLMTNAYGGAGEKECWGQRAPWVDYSGQVDDQTVGITIMDHKLNPLYPTHWHVRAYGLFGANPFGLSYYKSSYKTNGDWTLPAGKSATFKYRLYLHKENAVEARSTDRFQDWINPPSVE